MFTDFTLTMRGSILCMDFAAGRLAIVEVTSNTAGWRHDPNLTRDIVVNSLMNYGAFSTGPDRTLPSDFPVFLGGMKVGT